MRVLLIDDEQMVRKIVRKMLERSGHDVTEAETEAVTELEDAVDLELLDDLWNDVDH